MLMLTSIDLYVNLLASPINNEIKTIWPACYFLRKLNAEGLKVLANYALVSRFCSAASAPAILVAQR